MRASGSSTAPSVTFFSSRRRDPSNACGIRFSFFGSAVDEQPANHTALMRQRLSRSWAVQTDPENVAARRATPAVRRRGTLAARAIRPDNLGGTTSYELNVRL